MGKKLAILLALAVPKRVSEICRLDRRFMVRRNNCIEFFLPGISKTQKDCVSRSVKYVGFHKKKLCVVACILEYEKRTVNVRPTSKSDSDPLLRASRKPFNGLSPQTVGHWIKSIMSDAGIDTSTFKAHSCRMASTSKAALAGVNMQEILDMGDWSNAATFQKFYFRSDCSNSFSNKVLHIVSISALNIHYYISRKS